MIMLSEPFDTRQDLPYCFHAVDYTLNTANHSNANPHFTFNSVKGKRILKCGILE
jgi:hypothetical protein